MSDNTGIQWADATWNPVRGCSRVSPGCKNCYAEKVAARFSGPGMPYEGLAERRLKVIDDDTERLESRWTGKVALVPKVLDQPRRWQRPRRIFVNSMSDLFHESLSNEDIERVFDAMRAAPQHQFQVLTKRAKRMREWFEWFELGLLRYSGERDEDVPPWIWPLPNVWLGVSVEDQQRADERIPELLATPAAVRFLSCEPLLGPVKISDIVVPQGILKPLCGLLWEPVGNGKPGVTVKRPKGATIDWVIIGGESGPDFRPMDLGWARALVKQCADADVACFVKQMGPEPFEQMPSTAGGYNPNDLLETMSQRVPVPPGWTLVRTENEARLYRYWKFEDRKGGDMSKWPEELRVREFPR